MTTKYTPPKTMRVWGWPFGFHAVELIPTDNPTPAYLMRIAGQSNGRLYSCPKYFVHSRQIRWYNLKGHNTKSLRTPITQEEADANYWWVK